ncbi:MAG: hypothetical protein V3T83_06175 [Acidobacteriota bacterium]
MTEMRTPQLLIELARANPGLCRDLTDRRPCLSLAALGDEAALNQALFEEERSEREKDRQHWIPLKDELQRLRRERVRERDAQ